MQSIPSEEKFLDLSEVLRDCPDDFMFKDDDDEAQTGPDWDYESRFQREPPSGRSHRPSTLFLNRTIKQHVELVSICIGICPCC